MYNLLILTIFFSSASTLLIKPGAVDLGVLEFVPDYVADELKNYLKQLFIPPSNNNSSIQYRLYTRENRDVPCYIEPSANQFDKCPFDSKQETKFLIHGYFVRLPLRNRWSDIKDDLLQFDNYNVIIVNWKPYNSFPFRLAYRNAQIVGKKVAEMMKFIQHQANVSPETFHCIGHSLGSHVCGQAGRFTPNLGRITGLDPGGVSKLFALQTNIRLYYTDANFVDVMHTSDIYSGAGLGYLEPIGHLDFYPNGGIEQNHCKSGRQYKIFNSEVVNIQTVIDKIICNHLIPLSYFQFSIRNDCKFIAMKCNNYSSFEKNLCSSDGHPVIAEMGFPSQKIPELPPKSKFFLQTLEFPPYCKKNGLK